jgi:hypothetical protein
MKKLLYLALLIAGTAAFGQTSFHNVIRGISEIDYNLANSDYKVMNVNGATNTFPKDNWYNTRINSISDTIQLPLVDVSKIITVKTFFIKSKKAIMGDFYGRAEVQQWAFTNGAEAQKAATLITAGAAVLDERLYKGAWTFWQYGTKLYFILTPGTYMQQELSKIEKKLREEINKN